MAHAAGGSEVGGAHAAGGPEVGVAHAAGGVGVGVAGPPACEPPEAAGVSTVAGVPRVGGAGTRALPRTTGAFGPPDGTPGTGVAEAGGGGKGGAGIGPGGAGGGGIGGPGGGAGGPGVGGTGPGGVGAGPGGCGAGGFGRGGAGVGTGGSGSGSGCGSGTGLGVGGGGGSAGTGGVAGSGCRGDGAPVGAAGAVPVDPADVDSADRYTFAPPVRTPAAIPASSGDIRCRPGTATLARAEEVGLRGAGTTGASAIPAGGLATTMLARPRAVVAGAAVPDCRPTSAAPPSRAAAPDGAVPAAFGALPAAVDVLPAVAGTEPPSGVSPSPGGPVTGRDPAPASTVAAGTCCSPMFVLRARTRTRGAEPGVPGSHGAIFRSGRTAGVGLPVSHRCSGSPTRSAPGCPRARRCRWPRRSARHQSCCWCSAPARS
ncbi:hypothetical protein GA0074694_1729 [Micromonospora inyonensis]|uniref:Uncharacterized protein n=1 Tax=Micromonospora inyonensis TaxID=47866 RepID=A0A1C6RHT0_9ACTN|nr:hypothetical protein GA0074694_1729 [Micromonospora inyonensis]